MADQRVESLGHAFTLGLSGVLGDRLFGLYLLGAVAFPESAGKFGDIDFHAIVETPFDDADREAIDALHRGLGPTLGYDLDGQYIYRPEAARSEVPGTQLWPLWRWPRDGAWALHRAHARAGRRVLLVGPDPATYLPAPAWPELEAELVADLAFTASWLSRAPAYAVLQYTRLVYTFTTRDVVVSKMAAAAWGMGHLAEWAPLIARAREAYPADGTEALPMPEVHRFEEFARHRIDGLRASER